jgi:glutamyl-tRNA synthetase
VNFLALQGWSPRSDDEEFSVGEFIDRFDPHDISLGGPVFDLTKLDWLNGEKIRKLAVDELADRLMAGGFAEDWPRDELIAALPLFHDRLKRFDEFAPAAAYLLVRPEPDLAGLAAKTKQVEPSLLAAALSAAADRLAEFEGHAEEEQEAALRVVAENHGLKPGAVFMGLRVAVTGVTASPPLFPSIAYIGLDESLARVRALVDRLSVTS